MLYRIRRLFPPPPQLGIGRVSVHYQEGGIDRRQGSVRSDGTHNGGSEPEVGLD